MSAIKIIIAGASGRMGRMLIREVMGDTAFALLGATVREGSAALGEDAGAFAGLKACGVKLTSDLLDLVRRADAVIDFTSPDYSLEIAALAAQARIVHVCGTTGFGAGDEAKLKAAARHATIIRSANFSAGVALLAAMAERAAAALGAGFDIEIVEMHHRSKVDAPSGTALLLGEAAAKGRGAALQDVRDPPRGGVTGARNSGTIGFASLRGGTVVGEHSVIFAGSGERITLSHSAEDRGIFARGALLAAKWGIGKPPGLYAMADVLGLKS